MADQLLAELDRRGARITRVGSLYEAVAKLLCADKPFDALFVGVDFFGKEEFRLFPLLKKRWPALTAVTYASGGFRHKCSLADILGADARCLSAKQLAKMDFDKGGAAWQTEAVDVSESVPLVAPKGISDEDIDRLWHGKEDIVTRDEIRALLEEGPAL
ncbi:MAG: hypothetical protein QF662_03540 [Phycisphaerae bacterium]|nr:hypothetical protein [Phycisphaerae bacterium]